RGDQSTHEFHHRLAAMFSPQVAVARNFLVRTSVLECAGKAQRRRRFRVRPTSVIQVVRRSTSYLAERPFPFTGVATSSHAKKITPSVGDPYAGWSFARGVQRLLLHGERMSCLVPLWQGKDLVSPRGIGESGKERVDAMRAVVPTQRSGMSKSK